ncbi:MAG TPA: hypothetical protein VIV56_16870 [Gemmatimonadales bacterium]
MTRAEVAVVKELVAIIDYLAAPSPDQSDPNKRARIGVESGPSRVKRWAPGAWDGGRLWRKTDKRIAVAVKAARSAMQVKRRRP